MAQQRKLVSVPGGIIPAKLLLNFYCSQRVKPCKCERLSWSDCSAQNSLNYTCHLHRLFIDEIEAKLVERYEMRLNDAALLY